MSTSTLARPRPAIESFVDQPRRRGRSARPVALTVAGALLITTALAAAAFGRSEEHRVRVLYEVDAAQVEARNTSMITLSGPNDVTVVNQVYEAGESSGWHRHSGIHAVAVLAGSLTLYDRLCNAQTVVPGRPYVGGQELHMARNETSMPVEMVVTYLSPAGAASSTIHAASPCVLGGANG